MTDKKSSKGKSVAYKSLRLSEKNCMDIQSIYKLRYEAKGNAGQPLSSYDQFRVVAGQFARFACGAGIIDPRDIWKAGTVYEAITHLSLARVFIQNFQIISTCTTVTAKAMHLKQLSKAAERYFTGKEGHGVDCKNAADVYEYLSSVFNASKIEGRRLSRRHRAIQHRIENSTILVPFLSEL